MIPCMKNNKYPREHTAKQAADPRGYSLCPGLGLLHHVLGFMVHLFTF